MHHKLKEGTRYFIRIDVFATLLSTHTLLPRGYELEYATNSCRKCDQTGNVFGNYNDGVLLIVYCTSRKVGSQDSY